MHETGRDHVLIAAVHRHNKFIFFATPFPQKHETREKRPGLPCTRRPCVCVCLLSGPLNPSLSVDLNDESFARICAHAHKVNGDPSGEKNPRN